MTPPAQHLVTHLDRHFGRGFSSPPTAPACASVGGLDLVWEPDILFVEKEIRYSYFSKDKKKCFSPVWDFEMERRPRNEAALVHTDL